MNQVWRAAVAGLLASTIALAGAPARAATGPAADPDSVSAPTESTAVAPAPKPGEPTEPTPPAAGESAPPDAGEAAPPPAVETPPGDTEAPAQEPTEAPAVSPDLLEADEEPAEKPELPPRKKDDRPLVASPVSPPPAGLSLTIESSGREEVELFRIDPSAEPEETVGTIDGYPYVRVCVAPCGEPMRNPSNQAYFVAGRQVMPSRPFTLEEYDDEVTLRVRPGRRKIRFAGFGLTVAGAIMVPGGTLLAAGFDGGKGVKATGYTLIGVGLASLVAGIVLLVRGRTLVDIDARARGPGR